MTTTRKLILELLRRAGQMSIPAVAEAIGKAPNTVDSAVRAAWHLNLVHIAAWKRNVKGRMTALWVEGRGVDAERPVAYTPAQIDARCWRRKSPAYRARRAAVRQMRLAPATWLSGLGL